MNVTIINLILVKTMKAKRKGTNISFTENVLKHSLVRVSSVFSEENARSGRSLIGSGFFVESDLILTNLHGIAGALSISVENVSTNTEFPIEGVVAHDFIRDLVLLKVADEGIPIPIGDSDTVIMGNVLSVFGHAIGKRPVTERVRIHEINNTEKRFLFKKAFKQGQCGSPLLNASGEVIGVAVLGAWDIPILSPQSNLNSGYAIPANDLTSLLSCEQDVVTVEEWSNQPLIRSYHTAFKGQTLLLSREIDLAIEQFDIALEINPELSVAYCSRAAVYIILGEKEKAISDSDRAIELNPDYVDAYIRRATAYMSLNRYSKVIADCDAALKLSPDHYQASLFKAFANLSVENYDEALTHYDKVISLDDKSSEVYFDRAETKYLLNDFQGAIEDFSKVIRLSQKIGTSEDVYQRRGDAKYELGDFANAIKDYDKAIQTFAFDDVTYNARGLAKNNLAESETEMGRIKFAEKLYKEAEQDFTQAIMLDPQIEGYWNNRAISRKYLENFEGAIQDCDEAIQLNSDYFPAYVNRASSRLILAEGKTVEETVELYNESIEDYATALKLNPTAIAVYTSRGIAYLLQGSKMKEIEDYTNCIKNYQNAINDYTHAIKLDPNHAGAYNDRAWGRYILGKIETDQGNTENTSNLFQDALHDSNVAIQMQLKKPISAFYYTRACIYVELEDYNKAIEDFNEANRDDPKSASVLFRRGLAKQAIGEHEQAEEDFAAAKELDPDIESNIDWE